MADAETAGDAVDAWLGIPRRIEEEIEGLPEKALDLRDGPDGWSIRENVQHLVEANLIASNIVIAALARSGCVYDWSWVYPDASWLKRIGYDAAPVRPALAALRAVLEHIAGLVRAAPDGPAREVRLLDAPGAELYTRTVEEVLRQEVAHVTQHLADVARTRAAHGA